MATTTVPRWQATAFTDVEFDEAASHHLVVTMDEEAAEHVGDPAGVSVVRLAGPEDDALAAALRPARVGWRFVVVGRGAAPARVRAAIIAAGAVDAEVTVVDLGGGDGFLPGERDVYCAHCHSVTTTFAGIDESLTCSGCGSPLVVYYHFSRRHHAYLGFHPDAEELP
ncbi:dimethylamine monooxygenase subunit DmmA family protein [Williamsia muralis]|uniref:dimethylamine monooxygenase subunit DmmA family protein n=1 Tax=Williamsia marianensis TaxID=85044 RepID=UPI000DE6578F|nr:dimethylamine monooxygenase subunit DmmA family protein [Williamsia marianensis]PVY33702.1 hypothetical protein C7458_101101 [Williamsia marianensis]